jgi:hypothetical protein
MLETITSSHEASVSGEFRPRAKAFKTAKGSIYTYDTDGRTSRFKTATGEQEAKQDITVFVNLTLQQEQDILEAYRRHDRLKKTKVYVVERQLDNTPRIVRTLDQVQNPDEVYLAIYEDGQMARSAPASLEPVVGAHVFDTRHFVENGRSYTERHLGNKVTEISY